MNSALDRAINSLKTRRALAWKSFEAFFAIYFAHYIKCASAPFHKEIKALLMDESIKNLVIVGFRDSGKSSIVSVAYAIWSILGVQQKKYILIASQTQRQAKQNLQNIKFELESNELLRNDFGPLHEVLDEWGSMALISSKYGAKIAAVSTEQSIRGTRHGSYRPEVIICDDIEDLASVKTQEGRDKTYQWFKGEAFPAGSTNCRRIVVGNTLHNDSLIMRLKDSIKRGKLKGIYREYPLLNDEGECLWPGKYPTAESILELKRSIDDPVTWEREYMLKILPQDNQVVDRKWIKYYDDLPDEAKSSNHFQFNIAGVDLAISLKESADYTAIVKAKVFHSGKKQKIYILPDIFNKRIPFPTQKEVIKKIIDEGTEEVENKVLIENNTYQDSLVQELEYEGYATTGVKTIGMDKRARLSLITPHIKNGTVLFPHHGAEQLIEQLVGFGSEKHDDLVDALIIVVKDCVRNNTDQMESFKQLARLNPPPDRDDILDLDTDRVTLDMKF